MISKIIQERFDSYAAASRQEAENAMAEIVQEIALAGLSRSDFFKYASFQGGTCLRIIYGMQRFSEDMDFILSKPSASFRLDDYLRNLKTEFSAYGIEINVHDRSKADETIRKAFLKVDSLGRIISLENIELNGRMKTIKIKFEVDTNPSSGSVSETKYMDFPYPFPVVVQDIPSLFAGKSHALLCREYTKGRDWYDFVWYVGRKCTLNYDFLSSALEQTGPWQKTGVVVTKEWYLREMAKKIGGVDWDDARRDVSRFLKENDLRSIEFWNEPYFRDCLNKLEKYL